MPGQAQTTQRIPVTEIKPLLALAAERGEAHGVLTGPGADYMRRRFDATTPIEIDVSTCTPCPSPAARGSKSPRASATCWSKASAPIRNCAGKVSFCRDGSFPEKR
jgi:hypothetical protein